MYRSFGLSRPQVAILRFGDFPVAQHAHPNDFIRFGFLIIADSRTDQSVSNADISAHDLRVVYSITVR